MVNDNESGCGISSDSCQYEPVLQDEEVNDQETDRLVEQGDCNDDIASKDNNSASKGYQSYEIINSFAKKLLLVSVFIALSSLGTFAGYGRKLQVAVSDSNVGGFPVDMMKDGAANSATGEIFDSEKIRSFYGQRYRVDHEYPPVKTFTEPCKRWGVVTTIFDPTEAITRVANMPSWCLVIVPDLKTPVDYMDKLTALQGDVKGNEDGAIGLDNVFYFSIDKQKEWGDIQGPFGLFVRSTPWKHFCRKNIGYLFAILHGAEYIFDFDDDNFVKVDANGIPLQIIPEDQDPNVGLVLKDVNVIMQGANAFNHHPIMGASVSESWARGFPIELIQDTHTRGKVAYETDLPFAAANKEIGVIQFLADGNPDIDAMHRISKPLPMTFPLDNAKSVLVPTHAYAPYNAQATIHTKSALWATLLPGTVPGRVSDIWRSYFAQCIFHDSGLQLVFAPPKIVQERNEHNYLGDFNAEQDLYGKSGKLVEFLSEWDNDEDTVPKRMEALWIDLYERGYIEINDVYAVQMWLGALHQSGYEFPELKRRFRNVAVMGQFNYADSPTVVDDVIFWTQKQREHFTTVVAAAPFNAADMEDLEKNNVKTLQSHHADAGFFTPLLNQMTLLQEYKDHPVIEGVIYAHDDGILNVTELSRGEYPFPSDEIIVNDDAKILSYKDVRLEEDLELANLYSYRIFLDGHLEDFQRTRSFDNIRQMYTELPLRSWGWTASPRCGMGQTEMAKDPKSEPYREEDGSLLIQSFGQADFMYVPTKYTDEFVKAGQLHLDHGIFIECAYPNVVDMVRRKTDAKVRVTDLCTNWTGGQRGSMMAMNICHDNENNNGFIHPYKINRRGYKSYNDVVDMMQ